MKSVVTLPRSTGNSELETERGNFPVEKEKGTICREDPRVEVEEAENDEEEGHWCCE